MDFLGPSTLLVVYEGNETLTWRQTNPFVSRTAVPEHFHGVIDHNKHLFGKFFSLMGFEDITYVKRVTMCLVPLTLL